MINQESREILEILPIVIIFNISILSRNLRNMTTTMKHEIFWIV